MLYRLLLLLPTVAVGVILGAVAVRIVLSVIHTVAIVNLALTVFCPEANTMVHSAVWALLRSAGNPNVWSLSRAWAWALLQGLATFLGGPTQDRSSM